MEAFFSTIAQNLMNTLSTPQGAIGFVINATGLGLLVVASFVRTMVPLRAITVASNVLLLISGFMALSALHMILYLGLIPLNTWRLVEIKRLTRKVEQASDRGDLSGVWLKPYMKPRRLQAGSVLFRKGDVADALYLLVEGELELVEIGKKQPPGDLFGEISFFSPDRRRTLTARCETECQILSIGEPMFRQLYFQNPKFAFQVSGLIALRLTSDIERLRGQVRDLRAEAAAAKADPARPDAAATASQAQPLGAA